jgi:hypothetical protein
MIDENDSTSGIDDLDISRERVVQAVLDRIAAAQLAAPPARPFAIDLTAWAIPALIAASIVIIASGRMLLTTAAPVRAGGTVVEWLGMPRPVAEYLETGTLAPSEWLNAYGSRP